MPERKTKDGAARKRSRRGAAAPVSRRAGARRSRRILAVDVGSSDTKVGLLEGLEVKQFWRLTSERMSADEAALRIAELLGAGGESIRDRSLESVVCSVRPSLTLAWIQGLARVTGRPPLEVGSRTAKSLPIRYHDASSVGADRIANAIAARGLYGTPAIVVDLGTATTFDCVSRQGAYLGGVIAPGVLSSGEELFRRAPRLPRVELRRPARAVGRTTDEALQAGLIWGTAGQVDALVRRLALEMKGTPHVIATGGLASMIAPECETINRVDEMLTLKGMAMIWRENA